MHKDKWYGSAEGIAAVAVFAFLFGGGILALAAQWAVIFAVIGLIAVPFMLAGWAWRKVTAPAGASNPSDV